MNLLRPVIPSKDFKRGENIVLYPGAVPDSLIDLFDRDAFDKLPVDQIRDLEKGSKFFMFFRHFESAYNAYKKNLGENETFQLFKKEENYKRKLELEKILELDVLDTVDIDSKTPLSNFGIQQGENASKVMKKMFEHNPDLFPAKYKTSPYKRTRLTTYYLFKDVGLDIDLDQLLLDQTEANHSGVLKGSYNGKDVTIQYSDDIRERDHGNMSTPRFIKKEMLKYKRKHKIPLDDNQMRLAALLDKQRADEEAYFKAYPGGESQVQTNARAKAVITSFANTPDVMQGGSGHHLLKLGCIETIMGGSYYNFRNFDDHYKPLNGSLSIMTQVKETVAGRKNRVRFSAYNLELIDE